MARSGRGARQRAFVPAAPPEQSGESVRVRDGEPGAPRRTGRSPLTFASSYALYLLRRRAHIRACRSNWAKEEGMATTAASLTLGATAPDFALMGTDGRRHRLAELRGSKATLVMFICNHCPYVKAVLDDIVKDAHDLREHGVASVAIMPNDTEAYPDDSFDNMKRLAAAKKFSFPYVIDESQEVARAYGAVCTPDFFGFNAALELQYHGRIYPVRNLQRVPGAARELFDAMVAIAKSGRGPAEQYASMGCSVKWRRE
jgi:peroxiredoxin